MAEVEHTETRVKSEEDKEKKFVPKFNKKKNDGKSNAAKWANRDVPELLRGVEFSVARNGPDLYLKVMENCNYMRRKPTRMDQTLKKV